jgi:cell division ATPase FtsA|tara:strand:+ start:51168 stop:52352 length:1185 start_codon:yes stop_codon:yes gene_type:complete
MQSFVIFDIGSGSVGAALATVSPDDNIPMVLYSTRAPIAYKKNIHSYIFMKSMFASFQDAALEIVQKGIPNLAREGIEVRNINKILCIFSSPWYKSQTNLLKFKKEKYFDVSKKEIEKAVMDVNEEFQGNSVNEEGDRKLKKSKLIEKNITQIRLNGYPTNNPYDKKATNVELSLFLSKISSSVYENIREIIDKTFYTENISFHSFALVSFSVVRDIFHTKKNFLLMDIGGEVTDISLVRDEMLYSTASFPLGRNFLTRQVLEALNTIAEEANSLIRTFLEGKTRGAESAKIKTILDSAEKRWLTSFRKTLTDLSEGLSLPRTIFLTVDEDIGKWFEGVIKRDEFSGLTLAGEPFTVVMLSEKQLHKYCITVGQSRCDSFLAIETLFFHKIVNA